jgi:ketosteroid isomerase-like protein
VELVRSIYANWERGDWSSTEWAHPEIEFVMTGGGPADGSWTGHAGMAEGFRNYLSAWEQFRVQPPEFRALDEERVLALNRFSGRGKRSGLELSETQDMSALLFRVQGGAVTRLIVYATAESALADLGLAPATDSADS